MTIDYRAERVLITGASSGIGAEFARQVAARGADVVLVARRADRLEKLAAELSEQYGVTATALPVDLSQPRVGQVLSAALAAKDIEVTAIINNAGFATQGAFHTEDPDRLRAEIAVDVSSVVDISRTFINRMRERGAGFLVNVASMAAYQGNPTMAVYGATKAFVLNFTEALWYESRGTGVRVLAVSPGATDTEFFGVAGDAAGGGSGRMPAAEVVRTALAALEAGNPPPAVIAGRVNRLSETVGRLLGRRRSTMMVGSLMARASR
ncbi:MULTISPECIES: SDR family NAD(P)-dependent oxidoreductase [unclassified Streptomyces]|uniref:SDR family NAD(P)-dependent oxidoreductase n=1 Tax=unclassified Streptomyces TaxID=2593676 RepID=UPI0037F4892E